jgi:hypothetical protein
MQQPLSRQFVELGLQIHTHDDLRTVYVSLQHFCFIKLIDDVIPLFIVLYIYISPFITYLLMTKPS